MLLVDLDYFKAVNDNMGHAAGDQLLREVTRRMVSHLRQADTVARMGGTSSWCSWTASQMPPATWRSWCSGCRALQSPFVIVGKEITVSGTVGVVASGATYGSADEILRGADVAMYQAKQCERGSCATFDASMRATAGDRLQTGTDLRHAIADHRLVLYYQPIVDLATRQLAGLEALVRWPRAGFGVVQPGDFLPVATEIGLITQIGREVVSQACRQLAGWHWAGLLGPRVRVSVNVSHWEFWHASFISSLEEILVASGADPGHLAIEVTEGVILHDTAAAIAIVQQLRQRGIAVFLDGFSPGRSSLQGMRDLPVDGIKLERGFPVGLGANRRELAMAKTVVRACRKPGLDLVAEGIETEVQAQQLRSIGCHLGQGYWLAMPMPADEVRDLLGDERPAPILG